MANYSLICGIGCLLIFGPVLSVFAMVLGIRSSLRTFDIRALIGTVLGAVGFLLSIYQFAKPYLH